MKTILLALLFFAVALFVTVECRRTGPGKGKDPKSGKGAIGKLRKLGCLVKNCSTCNDGFVRITYSLARRRLQANKNFTVCKPCNQTEKGRMKAKMQVIDRDESKCPPVTGATEAPCSRNCAFCVDGECTQCNQGFAHVRHTKRQNVTRCVPCEMRNSKRKAAKFTVLDESQCPAACDKGCRNCVDGNCLECKAAYELDQESKQCEKKKVCGRGRNKKRCAKGKPGVKPNRKGGKRGPKTPRP